MNLIYKTYEPVKGYEKQQAQLYSKITGIEVRADNIKKRYKREQIDPLTVRYVFNENGVMLGYCQARDYGGFHETHIGYPWVTSECPLEAKHKLFDDLFAYIKTRTVGFPIKMNAANQPEILEFAQEKGFIEGSKLYYHFFPMNEVKKWETDDLKTQYMIEKATKENLKAIIQIYIELRAPHEDIQNKKLQNYFKMRVEQGFTNIVLKKGLLVGFSTPIIPVIPECQDLEGILMYDFTMIRAEHSSSILLLLQQSVIDNKKSKWQKKVIRIGLNDRYSELHKILMSKSIKHEIIKYKLVEG